MHRGGEDRHGAADRKKVTSTGASGNISWRSPVGQALLGKALGDTVSVNLAAKLRELTIAEIDYL